MKIMTIVFYAAVLVLFLSWFPSSAFAEVMDKEPSLTTNLLTSLEAAAIGLILVRIRWWLFPASWLVVLIAHYPILSEINDAFVGPAIRAEAGTGYIASVYAGVLMGLAASGIFALILKRRRDSKKIEEMPT